MKIDSLPISRILIIQTAFTGDVILATSVLETIYKAKPEAEIDFLVRKGNEDLVMENPRLKELIVWNKQEGKYRSLLDVIKTVRSRKYDLLINIQRYFTTGLISVLSGAKTIIGFGKNPLSMFYDQSAPHEFHFNSTLHEIERNHKLISWAFNVPVQKPVLHITSETSSRVGKRLGTHSRQYITIAPASVWKTKQFPKEKWILVTNEINKAINIFLVGGGSDKDFCQQIEENSSHPAIRNVAGELSLMETAALIKEARMNFSNDSAPLHMATATNAPVCAIYCSTLPSFGFRPLSDQSMIVEFDQALYCRPCGMHGRNECPEGHFDCAKKIEIDSIKKIVSMKMEGVFA